MHICVHTSDGLRLFVPLPNLLLYNGAFVGWLAPFLCRKLNSPVTVTEAQAREFARILRRWRRCAPDRTLVEVHDAEGNHVSIQL